MNKPMINFIKFKNQLLLDMGVKTKLVPENQIEEIDIDWDRFYEMMDKTNDMSLCPYCFLFLSFSCDGCPISKKGNMCIVEKSTYREILSEIKVHNKHGNGFISLFSYNAEEVNKLKDFVRKEILGKE